MLNIGYSYAISCIQKVQEKMVKSSIKPLRIFCWHELIMITSFLLKRIRKGIQIHHLEKEYPLEINSSPEYQVKVNG